jgi:hypothetical protein
MDARVQKAAFELCEVVGLVDLARLPGRQLFDERGLGLALGFQFEAVQAHQGAGVDHEHRVHGVGGVIHHRRLGRRLGVSIALELKR